MNISQTNYAYAFILTRSMLGLLSVIFVTELWPFIDVIILFLFDFLKTNSPNLILTFIMTRTRSELVSVILLSCNRIMALH